MRYLSVCSGIEAASAAWHDFGWTPVGFSEIEAFPSAVLAHRFPHVPNFGDMTKYKEWPLEAGSVDLLVGGTPCQSFSVAGLRKGLDDPRGNLMLTYLAIADHFRVPWLLWENVPGVLSSNGGRDFGAFVGALGQLGYRWAYRVLDAQHFGVPQRRRRVFVVASLGDGPHPAEVLFEPESLRGDPAPRRKTRKGPAAALGAGVDERGLQRVVGTLCADTHPGAYSGQDAYTGRLVPHINGSHWDDPNAPHPTLNRGGMGQIGYSNQEIFSQRGGGLVPSTQIYSIQDGREINKAQNGLGISDPDAPAYTIDTTGAQSVAICAHPVAFTAPAIGLFQQDAIAGTLTRNSGAGGETQNAAFVVQPDVPPTTYRKSRRAQSTEDHETWVEDEVSNTLNTFDLGDVRTTQAVVQPVAFAFEPRFYTREGTGGAPTQTPVLTASPRAGDSAPCVAVAQPVAFAQNQVGEIRTNPVMETLNTNSNATGRNTPLVMAPASQPVAFNVYPSSGQGAELQACPTDIANAVTVTEHAKSTDRGTRIVQQSPMVVRRLTPVECERLMGFPDDWTNIPYRGKPAADGPRYKALGNSMAVPVMRWIGQRIKDA